jgi:hypothetical protein
MHITESTYQWPLPPHLKQVSSLPGPASLLSCLNLVEPLGTKYSKTKVSQLGQQKFQKNEESRGRWHSRQEALYRILRIRKTDQCLSEIKSDKNVYPRKIEGKKSRFLRIRSQK